MKAKTAHKFACLECGSIQATWLGRCPSCGNWNTIELVNTICETFGEVPGADPFEYDSASVVANRKVPTQFAEFDRALSGGVILGSTTLIGGEPGIGKSTLAMHLAASFAMGNMNVLYVSAEESVDQISQRASRLGVQVRGLEFLHTVELNDVLVRIGKYELVIVDSVQAIGDSNHAGLIGSVNQVRHCAQRLNEASKANAKTALLLSHVTKDGSIAGPKLLEHLVDSVFVIEGDRSGDSRAIRCLKNRFGKVSEVGYMRMGEHGLADEPDQSAVSLADRLLGASGSVVSATRDGNRIRLVEVQVLAVLNQREVPRRQYLGVSSQRCSVILGLIEHFAEIRLEKYDLFVSIAGGMSFDDPGLDVAIAIAIVSGVLRKPVSPILASFGELGLTGEIRKVRGANERIEELRRHGFLELLIPVSETQHKVGRDIKSMKTLNEVLQAAGLQKDNGKVSG